MTARFASLQERAQVAVIAGVLLLVVMIGYFALIAPKRSTASDLKKQTAAVQKQIDANRSPGFTQALPAVRSASIFSIAKAMPKQLETANIILQLNQLATASGITFDQITPGVSGTSAASAVPTTPDTTDPFAAEPIQVQFSGSFYDLIAFLQRLRNLVRIENGHLSASGRLFDVSDISFCEIPSPSCTNTSTTSSSSTTLQPAQSTFPHVQAILTVNAFVPQQPQIATTTVPGGTDTTSTTTGATTTGATTTTSNPTSAAPSTGGGTS